MTVVVTELTVAAGAIIAGSSGQVIETVGGVAQWAYPPGYELDYAQVTASQTIAATTQAGATIFVTGNAVTYDGAAVMVEVYVPNVLAGVASQIVSVNLWDGATDLGLAWQMQLGTSGNMPGVLIRSRYTPAAGAHTLKAGAWVSSSTATMQAGTGVVGGVRPMALRVTKV